MIPALTTFAGILIFSNTSLSAEFEATGFGLQLLVTVVLEILWWVSVDRLDSLVGNGEIDQTVPMKRGRRLKLAPEKRSSKMKELDRIIAGTRYRVAGEGRKGINRAKRQLVNILARGKATGLKKSALIKDAGLSKGGYYYPSKAARRRRKKRVA